ncbi:glycosyltransferase family 4 protein [Pontibacter sp. CAU 1760]
MECNNPTPQKILIVGQTPPPFGGQSLMTHRLVNAKLKGLQLYHVRMSFSKTMKSIGHFEFRKVLHMFTIVAKAAYYRFKHDIPTLYYMPAGPNKTPVIRDIFMLFFMRLLYKKVIFHFRAAGVSEFVAEQPDWLRHLANYVYRRPDIAIHLSSLNPNDGGYFNARKTLVVPNGLEDEALPYLPIRRETREETRILYVGMISEGKGIIVLLEAMDILLRKGVKATLTVVGEFASPAIQAKTEAFVKANQIEESVFFKGIKRGKEKDQCFLEADIFCFPSHFDCESFGNVLVEAMMFELPVVSTRWRGIPNIVQDNETGFLVPIKSPQVTADKLLELIFQPELRVRMGQHGREVYLSKFSIDQFMENMRKTLLKVYDEDRPVSLRLQTK